MKLGRVCHITTAHPSRDVRIFHKECRSLQKAGHEVTLIVNEYESGEETDDGIRMIDLGQRTNSRIGRVLKVPKKAYRTAIQLDADLYHFHDPEFLPFAKKLVARGYRVIYDAHEDVPRQILSKHYIPKFLRKLVSRLFEKYEDHVVAKLTGIITATDHIRDRFLRSNSECYSVKNYPILQDGGLSPPMEQSQKSNKICYVGNITPVRGIRELVEALPMTDVNLDLGGNFHPPEFRDELAQLPGWKKVNELGFIDRQEVQKVYREARAGMVTLHPIINYVHALPVKMFEYMAAGLPVIASDFPALKQILNEHECGICVDPQDPEAIAEAIRWIIENPEKASEMGQNGQKAVQTHYNWESAAGQLLDAYRRFLNMEQQA